MRTFWYDEEVLGIKKYVKRSDIMKQEKKTSYLLEKWRIEEYLRSVQFWQSEELGLSMQILCGMIYYIENLKVAWTCGALAEGTFV